MRALPRCSATSVMGAGGSPRATSRAAPARRYRGDTLILETRHETATGIVRVTDLMPIGTEHRAVIRQVTGEAGEIEMALDLALRFDYGSIPPWLRAEPRVVRGVVGPGPRGVPLADRPHLRRRADRRRIHDRRRRDASPSPCNTACRTSRNHRHRRRGRDRRDREPIGTNGRPVCRPDRLARCGQALLDHACRR